MIWIKAQVSTEYLDIAGLVILLVIPITILYIKYTTESDYAITNAKITSIANEISRTANSAYSYGQDTQLTLEIDFPRSIESLTFPGNKDIVFKVRNKQGDLVDIVKQAEVNLFNSSTIPVIQGKRKIIVKSLGDKVLVQIPCTNIEMVCSPDQNFNPDCNTATKCVLKCENNVWVFKQLCTLENLCSCSGSNPQICQCGITWKNPRFQ